MAEGTVWSLEMVATLRAHAYGKATPAEIAALLGLTEASVKNKAAKIGLRLSADVPLAIRLRITDYATAGWRASRIARQLGLNVAVVEHHVAAARAPG